MINRYLALEILGSKEIFGKQKTYGWTWNSVKCAKFEER